MKITRLIAVLALILLTACSTPGTSALQPATSTPAQSLASTVTPSTGTAAQKVVEVSLIETSSYSAQADILAGDTAHVRLSLEPELLTITPASVSTQAWAGANLKDMQVCFGFNKACSLDGQAWKPFQADIEMDYPVDWLGSRTVWAVVQVRDASGAVVPAFLRYGNSTAPQAAVSYEIIGHIDDSVAIDRQPAFVQTAVAATRVAYPVTGAVIIQDGRCCVGGDAGTTVQVQVDFSAQSSRGKVTDMRVSQTGCQADAATLDAPWEPFAASKDYPVTIALNWTSFTVGVQYRDDNGNLSPVYCANIGVEGNPPVPTP